MIDPNKPLEAYTKEELLAALNSKKEIETYPLLQRVLAENTRADTYYPYFGDFLQMIYGKSSYTRMRGFGLCASLAGWDTENRIDEHLDEMLILLEDEKPATVRVTLSAIYGILEHKPYLASRIRENLSRIDCGKYKDTMAPLIRKDVKKLEERIAGLPG